jgi:hypothetical protein
MSANIPLPELAVQQPPNSIDQIGKILALKSLLSQQNYQQQMQPLQIEEARQQNQIRTQQLKDQQAMTKAMSQMDPTKGYSDLPNLVLDNGGSAQAAMQAQQHFLQIRDTASQIAQRDAATGQANIDTMIKKHDQALGILDAAKSVGDDQLVPHLTDALNTAEQGQLLDPQHIQAGRKLIASAMPPAQMRQALDVFENGLKGQSQIYKDAQTQAETAKDQAEASLKQIQVNLSKNSKPGDFDSQIDAIAPPQGSFASLNGRTKSMVNFALSRGDIDSANAAIKDAAQQVGAVEKETNPRVVATKEEVAATEAKASQLIKGMAEPGYAFNPKTGQTQLTDKTSYLQSGGALQAFRPIGEKDVRDDTMMENRLADVHQKVAEFEQALQKPVNAKDQSNMAALLGTDKTKLGIHPSGIFGGVGLEIPMDRVDAALNSENLKGLSANARDQLIAYKNAREAMMGYKTVLSGSARGSDKSMDLLTQALPDPSITDPDYSKRSLDAFKQNLRVVGQGLPVLPGIKSPAEVEAEVWGNQGAGGNGKTPSAAAATGHVIRIGTKRYQYNGSGDTADLKNYTELK